MRQTVFTLLLPVLAACRGQTPSSSLRDGRLAPCPALPHCVSTDVGEDAGHRMASIPFTDSPTDAQARARAALLAEHRMTIVDDRPGYLRAEARTSVFRFVDDVELLVDSTERLIHFRSSSRVGHNDWNKNRERMERVASRLATSAAIAR